MDQSLESCRSSAFEPTIDPPAPKPRARSLGLIGVIRAVRRNPLECWTQRHFEEPIVAGGLPVGHVLLVHEPSAIRHVLLDNATNYKKDWLQRRVLSAGLGDGLLCAEGERWRSQRRALAPMFARKNVVNLESAMVSAADAMINRWARCADGTIIDLSVEMTRVALDALERTIFSDGLGSNAEAVRLAMKTYFDTIGKLGVLDLIGAPDFVPRFSRLRIGSTLRFLERSVDQVITNRRRLLAEHPDRAPCDILTHLLNALDANVGMRMTEAEVRSNILTFIAAGHETTANSLSWALFLLSQSPEWRDRVAGEADRECFGPAANMAGRFVETLAVIEEAMRLYPPIAAISRVALGPDDLGSERVKRGSLVVIAPYVLHRHRLLWERPDTFDPSRFLGAARTRIDRFAYLPFGAGPRTCIGSAFALQEATVVLAKIARHFTYQMKQGHAVWPLLRVTLRPATGLPTVIRRRVPKAAPFVDTQCVVPGARNQGSTSRSGQRPSGAGNSAA